MRVPQNGFKRRFEVKGPQRIRNYFAVRVLIGFEVEVRVRLPSATLWGFPGGQIFLMDSAFCPWLVSELERAEACLPSLRSLWKEWRLTMFFIVIKRAGHGPERVKRIPRLANINGELENNPPRIVEAPTSIVELGERWSGRRRCSRVGESYDGVFLARLLSV